MTTQPPTQTSPRSTERRLAHIVATQPVTEGGGLKVNRAFPTPEADWFDPFLLLDEMAPKVHQPGKSAGVPPHPHRGFETVTYMFQGEIEHRDSAGNHGVIGPGDVQWMTAGDGIVHSEMTSERIQTEGGTNHGLQLWVNLPAALRRTTPRYQGLTSTDLPTVLGNGWSLHVIAGTLFGAKSPAESHTPVTYARLSVEAEESVRIPVPDGYTALLYVVDGDAAIGSDQSIVEPQHLAVFDRSAGDMVITATDRPLLAMVLIGEPINEPMERHGPFVMNTTAELQEAIEDFNAGLMGKIPAQQN